MKNTNLKVVGTYSANTARVGGFTLLELMVTVAIIGILAAVALPSYTSYITESRRTEATSALLDCAARLERNYTTARTYVGNNLCPTLSAADPDAFYAVTISDDTSARTYTVTATPVDGGSQLRDSECRTFTINQLGVQTALSEGGQDTTAECWKK